MGDAGLVGGAIHRPCHILQLDVVLVEILNHADVVVLNIRRLVILSRHRVVRHLGAVEASGIRLNHILNHLVIQTRLVLHVRIILFCNVNAVVKRLESDSGRSQLLLMTVSRIFMRLRRLVVVILIVQVSKCLRHITLHVLSHI